MERCKVGRSQCSERFVLENVRRGRSMARLVDGDSVWKIKRPCAHCNSEIFKRNCVGKSKATV